MAKGTVYGSERAIMTDPRSGLRIFRLTNCSTISMNLYFEMCAFTEDERHVVFISQRSAGRDVPWDVMRATTDGLELVQMTVCEGIGGIVVSPARNAVYYLLGEELRKVDILSLKDEAVAQIPGTTHGSQALLGSVDAAGKYYFASCVNKADRGVLFRVDITKGKAEVIHEGHRQNHIHVDPKGTMIYFNEIHPTNSAHSMINADGSNYRVYSFHEFAHHTWFGETGTMQGCLIPPGNALVTYKEGDAQPKILTAGRYYWHSSATPDAQWIVSDTNWPREGLFLLHVASGTVTYVCDPLASCSHPQWTHPHPSISPKLKYVLFNSDMTGLGQVYVAELTEEFIRQASKGYLCKSGASF